MVPNPCFTREKDYERHEQYKVILISLLSLLSSRPASLFSVKNEDTGKIVVAKAGIREVRVIPRLVFRFQS
jgi:hypothetical protein